MWPNPQETGHLYWRKPESKTSFFVQCQLFLQKSSITDAWQSYKYVPVYDEKDRRNLHLNKIYTTP